MQNQTQTSEKFQLSPFTASYSLSDFRGLIVLRSLFASTSVVVQDPYFGSSDFIIFWGSAQVQGKRHLAHLSVADKVTAINSGGQQ